MAFHMNMQSPQWRFSAEKTLGGLSPSLLSPMLRQHLLKDLGAVATPTPDG
jgi:hypothetical protein